MTLTVLANKVVNCWTEAIAEEIVELVSLIAVGVLGVVGAVVEGLMDELVHKEMRVHVGEKSPIAIFLKKAAIGIFSCQT